jgi:oligoribonuclease NrnB/cAMP/cGMP phosphodiesterase (DHH superfamily)
MLKPPVTVIYHADCLDGFGAAYAAWLHLGPDASYFPMHHGDFFDTEAIRGHQLFILDFSFPPPQLEAIARLSHQTTLIDHHKTVFDDWRPYTQTTADRIDYQHPELPLRLILDLTHAGTALAWSFFHPQTALPLPLLHIEENDLWRFDHSTTRAFCQALRLKAFDFDLWHQTLSQAAHADTAGYRAMIEQGETLENFLNTETHRLAGGQLTLTAQLRGEPIDPLQALRHGIPIISNGENCWRTLYCPAINAPTLFSSKLGNLLAAQSGTCGLTWHLTSNGEIKASLRSKGDFDVAEIARRYDGGGHRNAAGFTLPASTFLHEIIPMH